MKNHSRTSWFVLLTLALPAMASALPQANHAPARVTSVPLAADGKCPASTADEVVVCHPVDEPYRIPKPLRRTEIAAADQSWVNRAATLDETSRVAGGLPDTCSVVGTGGQTGCALAAARAWAAERRAARREAESIP